MKKLSLLTVAALLLLLLAGCGQIRSADTGPTVAATTAPVADFASAVCAGTDITVTRVITDSVSCLHNYSLSVRQMKDLEQADVVLLSGVGLEDFMSDALADSDAPVIDLSQGVPLLASSEEDAEDGEYDPHIWLDPDRAAIMVQNLADGLSRLYPDDAEKLQANAADCIASLHELAEEGRELLSGLSCRELITFHDGFAYLADSCGLTILEAIEEESGSEASAAELTRLTELIRSHDLPAVFTETNGSVSAAQILQRETGCEICSLDMCMGDTDYFTAMRHNYETLEEALK